MKNFNFNFKSIVQSKARWLLTLIAILTLGMGQMWGANTYILGPDGSWTENTTHQMVSSGISNWLYKDLTVSGQWTNFKVHYNNSSWYGKDSGGNNVTPGTEYTPTTTGDNMYCDFKASSLTYYFFFNTSTKKLMIQPKYYLAGTCGASNQSWGQTQNAPTYDATNGYFKWNTCSLTANTAYKFKLCTYNTWSYYNYQDGSSVTVANGTKQTTDGDNNIIFKSTYAGTAVITLNPATNAMVVHCPYRVSYAAGTGASGSVSASAVTTYGSTCTLSSSTFSKTGYTQDGWATSDGGDKVYNLGATYTGGYDNVTLYPHWVENTYNQTIAISPMSTGTTSPTAGTGKAIKQVTGTSVTATPATNYAFDYWSVSGGGLAIKSGYTSTSNPAYFTASSAGGTITANFAPQWNIKGSMSNDDWGTFYALNYVSGTTFRGTITLAANTTYEFKVVDRKNNGWYGNNSGFVGQTSSLTVSTGESTNCHIYTAAAGTYTFEFDSDTKALTVTYPSVTHPSSDYIYFKNTSSWSPVYVHLWGSGASSGTTYPGPATQTFTFDGVAYNFAAIGQETSAIFGNNNDSKKTGDITNIASNKGKYYDFSDSEWKDFTLSITYKDQGNVAFSGSQTDPPTTHTYGTATTLKTASKTGYTFGGWFTNSACTGSSVSSLSATGYTSAITLYAKWTADSYTTSNNIKESDGSTNAGTYKVVYDATSITYTTTPSKTGYNIEGLYYETSLTNKIVNDDASLCASTSYTTSGSTWKQTSAPTLYVKWDAKTYTAANNIKEANGDNAGKYTATYDATSITINTTPTKSGYHVEGYYTSSALTTKVASSTGALEAGVTGWTDASRHWIKDANVNLYVKWEENAANYTLTFGVANSPYNNGTLSVTAGGAAASSGSEYVASTAIACTATPSTHYRVKGWYSDNSCTSAIGGAGTGNTYNFSLAANTVVYVGFEQSTCTITLDRNGGATGSSVTATHGSTLPSFTPASYPGYTLNGYFTETSGGTKIINADGSLVASTTYADGSKQWKVNDRTLTLYAQWTENKVTLTPTVSYDHGTSSYTASSANTVGVTTTTNLSCSAPTAAHYTFGGWTLTNLTVTSGNAATDRAITVKITTPGSPIAAVANYNEVLTTTWYINGDADDGVNNSPFEGWGTNGTRMEKKSGYSTVEKYYCTITVGTTATGDGFGFKVYNSAESTDALRYHAADGKKFTVDANSATVTNNNSYPNMGFKPYLLGDYEFELDNTGASPVLTIHWPVFNQVRISAASPTSDAGNVGNFDLSAPVSNVRSKTLSLKANNSYTFKIVSNSDWYGFDSGTFTRSTSTSSNSRTISTSGGDMTLTTDYAGDYTFKFNESTKALTVDFPTAYKIIFGKGAVDGTTGSFSAVDLDNGSSAVTSNSTWVKSGNRVQVTAPDAKTGYRFLGWYDNNSATGDAITTNANCTISVTAATTVYACYALKQSALTLDKQTSATGYGSAGTVSTSPGSATYGSAMPALSGTMPTAAEGYAFMGFYDATVGGGTKYYNADGSSAHTWDKDVTTGTTLYAYYKKAEITELTFDAASVETGGEVGVTPTIAPTPEPTVSVCWRVLYNNDNPLDPQPEISWNGTKATFTAPLASGTYKVEAKLYTGSSCGGGTLLDTRVASFTVAGTHTVTINYKCGDDVIKASTTTTGRPFDWSGDITAPDIFGYTFSSWTAGDGITIKDGESSTATTHIKATYNGTLTANYTQKSLIYFKNTLGWEDVYVNFLSAAKWTSGKGSGNSGVTNYNKHMTRIGDSDVWYYDYGYNDGGSSISPSLYVSFTSDSQNGYDFFWKEGGVNVVYPANYPDAINTNKSSENGFKAATPMFVPLATQDGVTLNSSGSGKADYYNAGYWTKYTPGTGYRLEIYNSAGSVFIKAAEFTSGDDLMPMTAVVDLDGGQTYKFQLRRGGESSAGIYYGNSGTMTYANHGQNGAWDMTNGSFSMCGITTTASGNYTFHLSYGGHPLAEAQYRLRMAVDYPVATGDYRVIYKDNVHTGFKPSAIVQKVNNSKDTVSFFIRPGQTPVMKIQQATVNGSTGAITWSAGTDVSSSLSALSKDSVYNICLTMDENGAISVENVAVYTGNFYIRTDAANSKWDNYRSDPDHRMTYSEYSITHGGYSHYYCHWVQADDSRKNVKFVIANDYSPCISDTLTRETASGTWANIEHHIDEYGNILRNANVRFMWNQHDNTVSRAYVDGAQGTGSNIFLYILSEDGKIKKSSGSALDNNKVQFSDNGNWIYEANIQAQPDAAIKLLSNWSDSYTITQYFKGGVSSTETLIGGSGSTWYNIRVIYDYKTNRLVSAWIPSGEIGAETNINADVMFIREHQGDIAQLTFTGDGAIKKIETAYGVLRFNKWTLNNKDKSTHTPLAKELSRYERDLFYVSFPFRVSMEEVFGFGTYGTHWIIEYYDGAGRAANGYWLESGPNWKFITNRKGKFFEPYEGYIIALDLDELGESSDVWANTDQVELYFPSYGSMPNITNASYTHEIPAHLCTINRSDEPKSGGGTLGAEYDRRVKDSHWNVLSVPTYVNINNVSFANTDWITTADDTHVGPNFLYEWNPADNTVTARSGVGYNYHAMHAYLVQYCGNVTWTTSVSPALAPRRNKDYRGEYEFRLEMLQNDEAVDQTYVKLSENEAVTTGFEFNYDMSKEFNKNKANIYTMITSNIDGDLSITEAAGNVLPMSEQTTVVPVGVKIVANGDYTFSIPDGTEGTGVTLIDNETGVHTNLALMDYTVALEAGTYDERFILEISPIAQTPTGVDTISDEGLEMKGARKVIIDEKMYILKDGKVYDARGARVQ